MCLVQLPSEPVAALRVLEAATLRRRISERAFSTRKARVVKDHSNRLRLQLQRIFRRESARVLDLLRAAKVEYPTLEAVAVRHSAIDPNDLANWLLNGLDPLPYQAAFYDTYGDIMPDAMAALIEQMAARGVGIGDDLMHFPRAQEWIRQHKIEFSERYAKTVTATTNKRIRATLSDGWRQHEGMEQLIERVQQVYREADAVRAEMIARTESSRAYNGANLEMGRELGAETKFWIISGSPYSLVDVCSENDAMGSIPITQSFRDDEGMPIDGPPAHVNCLCDVGYDFAENWELPEEMFRR